MGRSACRGRAGDSEQPCAAHTQADQREVPANPVHDEVVDIIKNDEVARSIGMVREMDGILALAGWQNYEMLLST